MGRSVLRPYKTAGEHGRNKCEQGYASASAAATSASRVSTALFGLELFDGFEDGVADDGEGFRGDFVEGVLGGVPVGDFEVDDVYGFDAAVAEGLVVVVDGGGHVDEDAGIAKAIGGRPDDVGEGFVGIGIALEAEFAAADDVGEDEGADIFEVAAHVELGGHLAAAVTIVGIFPFEIDGFFAVEEGDPYLIAAVLAAKIARDFEHDGSR